MTLKKRCWICRFVVLMFDIHGFAKKQTWLQYNVFHLLNFKGHPGKKSRRTAKHPGDVYGTSHLPQDQNPSRCMRSNLWSMREKTSAIASGLVLKIHRGGPLVKWSTSGRFGGWTLISSQTNSSSIAFEKGTSLLFTSFYHLFIRLRLRIHPYWFNGLFF